MTRWYRAPEVLCESATYGPGVDVWSAGCILAEVLGRTPLLRGSSTRDQLQLIVAKLGAPSEEDLAWVTCAPARDTIRAVCAPPPPTWAERFPHATPLCLDLLARMLAFNPAKRISVDDALAHPYLAQLHARATEPVAGAPFDFAFEAPYEGDVMPADVQRRLMWDVVVSLRDAQRADFRAAGIDY